MILNRPPNYATRLSGIPPGPVGIRQTLRNMAALVQANKVDPFIRKLAIDIVQAWPEKDTPAEAAALQTWVRDSIRYTSDIDGVETLQTPQVTLDMRGGDCDDKSILLATLLASIGHTPQFVALGYRPGEFCHVLVEDVIGGMPFPLETTEPVDAGWYPFDMPQRMVQAT